MGQRELISATSTLFFILLQPTILISTSETINGTSFPSGPPSFPSMSPLSSTPGSANSNITIPLGGTAHLHCPVKLQSGDQRATAYPRVSWMRQRDWHILTVGRKAYTTDARFRVIHREGTLDWLLEVKFVQLRDSGMYECQVRTGSKVTRHVVELVVTNAKAEIDGGLEKHLEEGSRMSLLCSVVGLPDQPSYVFWYRDNTMVNYDTDNGITVNIKHLPGGKTESRLEVSHARLTDSGNYSCQPANSRPAHISVFVNEGDKMQPRKSKGGSGDGVTAGATTQAALQFWLLSLVPVFHWIILNCNLPAIHITNILLKRFT